MAAAKVWVRLEKTAHAINEARLDAALVIITGRNRDLKYRLEQYDWNMPVSIYGFVRNMPDFMQASNVLVTKAGPGTISEACISGLPIILYSKVPGQEDGNVDYVVNEGAGVWAPATGTGGCHPAILAEGAGIALASRFSLPPHRRSASFP